MKLIECDVCHKQERLVTGFASSPSSSYYETAPDKWERIWRSGHPTDICPPCMERALNLEARRAN